MKILLPCLLGCILWGFCGLGLGDESSSQHELPAGWTGQYYFGDGLGANCYLTLNTNGTFTFKWQGCVGTYDENEGSYSFRDGLLILHPNKPNVRAAGSGTPTEFYIVSWATRHYLIPAEDIVEFCSEKNLRMEPRPFAQGSYYLRSGEWKRIAHGFPNVPEKFKKYLLQKPVFGHVVSVISAREAIMDKGAADGLLPNMLLVALNVRDRGDFLVEVMSVNENDCRIKMKWEDEDNAFVLGQRISSAYPDF